MQYYEIVEVTLPKPRPNIFVSLKVGQGFLVPAEEVLDALHQATTMERETPGWTHGRSVARYNSNVLFYRAS